LQMSMVVVETIEQKLLKESDSEISEPSRSKTETIIEQIGHTQEELRSTLVDIANREEKLDDLKQKS
ncbi:10999_t:CDS:2, partial [Scutellospora calospora]